MFHVLWFISVFLCVSVCVCFCVYVYLCVFGMSMSFIMPEIDLCYAINSLKHDRK